MHKGNSSHPCSATDQENIELVQDRPEASPRKSTRRLSQETEISRTSVLMLIYKELHAYPYKNQILQHHIDRNKAERQTFCEDISERFENNPGLLDLIFF